VFTRRVHFGGGYMRSPTLVLAALLAFSLSAQAQSNTEKQRAQEVLTKVRAALGGDANLKSVRGLSLTGVQRRFTPGKEIKGEIKVDLLAPDKFLKSEKADVQPMVALTLLQAVNGAQTWIEQQISKPSRQEDGLAQVGGTQSTTPIQVTTSTMGMRDITSGTTTIRATPPGAAPTERSVLGMRMPTATGGQERDTSLEKMDEAQRAAKQQAVRPTNKPPGLEDPEIKAAMERQLRKDFLCLSLVWLQRAPASIPLEFTYGGAIKAEHGQIEAIEVSSPDGFAARLFVEQASHRPVMISYPEVMNRKAGYVVSSNSTDSTELQEIAVQLYFGDYRPVNGVLLPFLITKAINGVRLEEWRIEKYKLNPDLKPKKFEKK
jgi:hypothetical protein